MGQAFQQVVLDGPFLVAAGVAALVGLISFASPCVLPLVPGYLSYVTGLVGTGARAPQPAGDGGRGDRRPHRRAAPARPHGHRCAAVRARLHRRLRRLRGPVRRPRALAAGLQRRDHPGHGRGHRARRPGLPRLAAVPAAHEEAVRPPGHRAGRCAPAGRGVRAGLDAVPGPDAVRGQLAGVLRGHRRPRGAAGRRLLPRPRRAVRAGRAGRPLGRRGHRVPAPARRGGQPVRRRGARRRRVAAAHRAVGRGHDLVPLVAGRHRLRGVLP